MVAKDIGEQRVLELGSLLPPVSRQLSQEKIDRYAKASGDHNPLHTDPEFAAGTDFKGTIAHGMLLLAYVSEMLTEAFGKRWPERGRLKVRFRAPGRPGDTITIEGRVTAKTEAKMVCTLQCVNQRGEMLVSGEAEVIV